MMRRPSFHPRRLLLQCALSLLATAAMIVHGLTTSPPPPLLVSSSPFDAVAGVAVSKSSARCGRRDDDRRRRRQQNNFVVLGAAANNQDTTNESSSSSTASSLVQQSAVKSQLFSAFTNLALTDQYDAVLTGLAAKILDAANDKMTPERTVAELSNCYDLLTEMNQKQIAPSPRSTMAMIDVRLFFYILCFFLAVCVCLFVSLWNAPHLDICCCCCCYAYYFYDMTFATTTRLRSRPNGRRIWHKRCNYVDLRRCRNTERKW
jgi:hypothetical protein